MDAVQTLTGLDAVLKLITAIPNAAIWIFLIFYVFKVVCIGSIYGVLRLAILSTKECILQKTTRILKSPLADLCDSDITASELECVLKAIMGRNVPLRATNDKLHPEDIKWMKEMLDKAMSEKSKK